MVTADMPLPRVPAAVQSVQINHCKNPLCLNFGLPASLNDMRGRKAEDRDQYRITGGRSSSVSLTCLICEQSSVVKSNQAVVEERDRLFVASGLVEVLQCPNESCGQLALRDENVSRLFSSNGATPSGTPRLRCKACRTTFTPGVRQRTQRRPELDELIFRLLVNKMPMRRICETADIPASTLYSKINFIFNQSRTFAANMERSLLMGSHRPARLYVSTDKQDYIFNWGTQLDRRNIMLTAIGSVDNASGYVLAMHLNFDPEQDPEVIETAAKAAGDYERDAPFRRYARLWLQRDYLSRRGNLATEDPDILPPLNTKRPSVGMQVRSDYSMLGHFFFLGELCAGTEKLRFFLDRDPGMQTACAAAFVERIKEGSVDVFTVTLGKSMTIDDKKRAKAKAEQRVRKFLEAHPGLDAWQVKAQIVRQEIEAHYHAKDLHCTWLSYPFPDMGEPEKAIRMVTDAQRYDLDHLARLYTKVSLQGVDKFFMLVRRRLSIFERPIHTANNANRTWHGYSGYNPAIGAQLLCLFRVFYNYALLGEDKATPAMRLGLAERPYTLREILDANSPSLLASKP